VKKWFKSRRVGELYIIREIGCVYKSATRTSRTGYTGRETMVYESYSW